MNRSTADYLLSATVYVSATLATVGCAKRQADPFAPDDMIQSRTRLASEPQSPVDQPGAIPYDNPNAEPVDRPPRPAEPREGPTVPRSRNEPTGQGAGAATVTPDNGSANGAATQPSGAPVLAGYETVGGVVARVNNTPIYAEQVLEAAEPKLSKLARELSEETFRRAAQKEIAMHVMLAIQEELRSAAAERMLPAEDVQRAKDMTAYWRTQQINAAGGSVQTARERAAKQGLDFEALVKRRYREAVWEVYRVKKLYPQIRVTASDLRRYYEQHRAELFTVPDQAQFELIKIDPKKVGTADAARAKAEELRSRAAAGENFTKLAEFSHGPRMRTGEGSLNWIQRGSFAVEPVERAVWQLEPGGVTPVVEDGGAFYLARLEQKKSGHVIPFDDEAVQERIQRELRVQQYNALKDELTKELGNGAVIRGDPTRDMSMMQPAVEIAMQRYAQWASAK